MSQFPAAGRLAANIPSDRQILQISAQNPQISSEYQGTAQGIYGISRLAILEDGTYHFFSRCSTRPSTELAGNFDPDRTDPGNALGLHFTTRLPPRVTIEAAANLLVAAFSI